jgi:parallel beta-helix repeat protein
MMKPKPSLTNHLLCLLILLLVSGCSPQSAAPEDHNNGFVEHTTAPPPPVPEQPVPEPVPAGALVLYVDGEHGTSDGDGSSSMPYATLKQAVARVNESSLKAAGSNPQDLSALPAAVVVRMAPGIYREGGLSIQQRNTPVTIESLDPAREVVISGADIWDTWEVSNDILTAAWPHNWGEARFNGWPAAELRTLQEMGKRCEMVFVNGQLLRQVEAGQRMKRGEYSVDPDAKTLSVRLPADLNPANATVEVSTRPHLLFAGPMPGLTLRNLVFTQANNGDMHPGLGNWAVLLAGEQDKGTQDHNQAPVSVDETRAFLRNVLIENCRFEWNNAGGLTLANAIGVEVRNSRFDHNGTNGVGANRCKDVLYEDCTFDGNNWRYGKWGHAFGWAPAGTKQLFISDAVYRRCSFSRNYATGLWLDFGNENIVVEDCVIADNWYVGFYFEASYGPCLVKNTEIVRNAVSVYHDFATGGVLFAESKSLTLENCLIADNANFQIGLRSRERKSSGYWSKTRFNGLCEHLTVNRCVIRGGYYAPDNTQEWFTDLHRISTLIGASTHSDQEWFKKFLPTYRGDHNVFIQGFAEQVFSRGGNYGLDRVSLAEWQALTGQDTHSTFHSSLPVSETF